MTMVMIVCMLTIALCLASMLQATRVQDTAETIQYTPASTAVVAGQVVVLGNVLFVAERPIAVGEQGTLTREGVFAIAKKNEAFNTVGVPVYWDADGNPYGGTAGTGAITAEVTDTFAGYVWATAGATAATVQVGLDAAPDSLTS